MYVLLTQFVLARRNDDVEGWMNVLFVIVMAVVWVLGGILKAKSNKSAAKGQARPAPRPTAFGAKSWRQSTERPQNRPAMTSKRPEYRPGRQTPPARTGTGQPLFKALAAQIEQAARARMAALAPPPPQTPPPKPRAQKPPVSPGSIRQTKAEALAAEVATEADKYTPPISLMLDHEHQEDLRRAILYCEILGKPVSLREPYESIIGP